MTTVNAASAARSGVSVEPGRDAAASAANHPLMLPVLLTGLVMAAIDNSIVNVAAPALRRTLAMSGALLQMVIAGYVIAYAVLLVLGARLGEDHGYRKIFVVGAALFTAMSLACGLAPEPISLIVARVVQGAGAALMVPQVLSLIQLRLEGAARARAVGLYSTILGLGVVIGQLMGGLIVSMDVFNLSWRPVFLLNVPIGLIVLAYSKVALPAIKGANKPKLDVVGVTMLSLSILLAIIPLTFGREVGWALWTYISLALGVAGLVVFAHFEKVLARRAGSPLLNPAAFSQPGMKAGLLVVFAVFALYGGKIFAIALYLQSGLGYSPLASGLVFAAQAMGFGIGSRTWSKLPPVVIRWAPSGALLCLAATEAAFGTLALQRGWMPYVMVPLLVVTGVCPGWCFGPAVNQMASRIQPQYATTLSGLVTTTTQLAIVVGIATLGTFYLTIANSSTLSSPSEAIAWVLLASAASALVSLAFSLRLALTQPSAQA
jgi:MFS family permease